MKNEELPEWSPDDLPEWSPDAEVKVEAPKESKGWSGILSDILKNASGYGNAAKEAIPGLLQQGREIAYQLTQDPIRALENTGAGIARGVHGGINTIPNVSEYLASKGLTPKINQFMPELEKANYGMGNEQPGDAAIQGIASYAPYSPIGLEAQGIKGILKRGAAAGAYGIGQKQDPILSALMQMGGEASLRNVPKVPQKIADIPRTPTDLAAQVFQGRSTPQELANNLRAAEGTNTPLGSVIGNRSLNVAYDTASHVPFSGSEDIMHNLKNQIENKAAQTVENLAPPNATGDLNTLTQSLLDTVHEKQKDVKNKLYKDREVIEKADNHQLELPKFEKLAKERTKSIEESPLYKDDPRFRSQYNELMGYKNNTEEIPGKKSKILDKYGNPYQLEEGRTIRPSLTEAQVTAGDMYERAQKLKKLPNAKDQILGNNLESMAKALREDIKDSISKGSPELQNADAIANKNFKENYAPFKDEDVFEKIKEKEPQTIVREIIQPGKSADKYRDIEKINALLPDNQKHLLGYAYLKGAVDKHGNIDPKELAKIIKNLGNRQFKALFPDEAIRQSLLDYGTARGMNEKALNRMYIAETGAKSIPLLVLGSMMASGPMKATGIVGGARAFNKWATSPAVREKIVNKMVENAKKRQSIPAKEGSLPAALSQALVGARSQKQE